MNLTAFSLRNRTLVLCVVVAMFGYGLITFRTMARREDPAITIRTAVITTKWPGATARKVEELVTDPIETAIKKMAGIDEIRSDSRTGLSIVYVDLLETIVGADIDQYWDELRNKVDEAKARLPDGCGVPSVNSDFGDVYDDDPSRSTRPRRPGQRRFRARVHLPGARGHRRNRRRRAQEPRRRSRKVDLFGCPGRADLPRGGSAAEWAKDRHLKFQRTPVPCSSRATSSRPVAR